MKRWAGYTIVSAILVCGGVALVRPFVGDAAVAGLMWAGGLALLVQCVAFGLAVWLQHTGRGFLLAMAGGTLARLGVLGAAGVVVTVVETGVSAEALILGLAGFLFALALLEAVFLRSGEPMGQSG